MTFAWPHLLWLLLLPAALFLWDLTHRRRTAVSDHAKILRAEAGTHSLRLLNFNLSPSTSQGRLRPWLCLGLAFSLAAAARPQWGRIDEPVFDQAREILIAIDLSRSMLTPDVKPSRLERAKLLTQALLEKLSGERVGLVVFSGTAFLQSPLSADYEILREFLPALNPEFLPEGGTNYRALIDTSLSAFGSTAAADRFLIVLSDGEATEDNWRDRIGELKTKGIRVLGLGVGTTAGAMIPDGTGSFVKDERGAVVLSKLESGTLRELATATNGVYQDASTWIDLAGLITSTVETGRKGQFMEKNSVRLVERFQWPLALGLWLLLVSLYYEFPVRPKPREIRLTGSPSTPTAGGAVPSPRQPASHRAASTPPVLPTAALLVLLLSPFAPLPSSARVAEDTGPALGRIYSRLAEQDRLHPQDYAEIARETLRWGQRIKENGQPVIPGPVHDAIQAVDALIAIDSKITDWTKLRAELEALLEKPEQKQPPPEQNQDQQQQDKENQDKSKQDQQKQDQSKSGQQEKQDQQDQQQKDSSQQKDPSQQPQNQPPPQQKESAFGDMKDKPPPPPQDTQKVGGVPEKKPTDQTPVDPSLALPLQKLEQLKNQDSPAELFKLMEGDKDQTPRKKTKDW